MPQIFIAFARRGKRFFGLNEVPSGSMPPEEPGYSVDARRRRGELRDR
jgi:hypothetical protein